MPGKVCVIICTWTRLLRRERGGDTSNLMYRAVSIHQAHQAVSIHRYARLSTSPPVQFRDWHLAPLRSSVQQRRCTLDEMESFEVAARPGQRGRLREVGWGSMP